MPVPKSAVKIKRDGVEYVSNVDRANYLITELTRAALRDVGKLMNKRIRAKARALSGLRKGKRVTNAFQYWVRKKECDLQVGVKHGTWYGEQQELGTKNQPKRAFLRDTVYENIEEIRKIEGVYLSYIENENKALAAINEDAEGDNDDE